MDNIIMFFYLCVLYVYLYLYMMLFIIFVFSGVIFYIYIDVLSEKTSSSITNDLIKLVYPVLDGMERYSLV